MSVFQKDKWVCFRVEIQKRKKGKHECLGVKSEIQEDNENTKRRDTKGVW